MPLALSRDPGPTPSVGHVTGDMKRRESNETQALATESWAGPRNEANLYVQQLEKSCVARMA